MNAANLRHGLTADVSADPAIVARMATAAAALPATLVFRATWYPNAIIVSPDSSARVGTGVGSVSVRDGGARFNPSPAEYWADERVRWVNEALRAFVDRFNASVAQEAA